MKTMRLITVVNASIAALLLLANANALAATIYYVGTVTNANEVVNWLTPTVPKTYDITGDNIYGNFCAIDWLEPNGGTYSPDSISWVNSGPQYRQAGYVEINSVGDASQGNAGPGALVNLSPTNTYCGIALGFSMFQVNVDLTNTVLRVGVMDNVLDAPESPDFQFDGLYLEQTAGGTFTSSGNSISPLVPLPYTGGTPVMVFFDIVNAQAGDQFLVEDLKNVGGVDSITTVTGPCSWDTNAISTVSNAPTILAQTPDATCMVGDSYMLEAVAGGAPTPTYQWYENSNAIELANTDVYTITNATLSDSGSYYVVASTLAGSVTSSPVTITVVQTNTPTGLTLYRDSVMSHPGLVSYYNFDNGAEDTVSTNEGTFSGTPVVGYHLAPGVGGGEGGGLHKSVEFAADGALDFGDVPAFTFPSGNGTIEAWVKCNPNWTNSPLYDPAIVSCGNSWLGQQVYTIEMSGSGLNYIGMNNGSAYDTIPIPYAGTNWHHMAIIFTNGLSANGTWTLMWDGVNEGTINEPLGTSGVSSPTELGNSCPDLYEAGEEWIGDIDEVAFFTNALSTAEVTADYDAMFPVPRISQQPESENLLTGLPFQLNVSASGNNLAYQWYEDDAPISGDTTNSINFPSLALSDAGSYFCVVSNNYGAVTSTVAALQVSTGMSPPISNYITSVESQPGLISLYTFANETADDSWGTNNGTLEGITQFIPGFGGGPDQALALTGSGWVNLGDVPALDLDDPVFGSGTVTLWWRAGWTTSPGYDPCLFSSRDDEDGGVNYSIHVGGDQTYINFWNGSSSSEIPISNIGTNWHYSAVIFNNGTYTFTMDGQVIGTSSQYNTGADVPCQIGSSGPYGQEEWIGDLEDVAYYSTNLTVAQAEVPYTNYLDNLSLSITSQPQGEELLGDNNDTLTLSVTATGANLSYQWYENNAPINGANASTLDIPNASPTNSGNYFVVISNDTGSITSQVASVSVVAPATGFYQSKVLANTNLISYYTFDQSNADDMISTNNGTFITTSMFTTGVGGGTNVALYMDGVNGAVGFGSVPAFDFNPSGVGTIEMWVQADWDPTNMNYAPAIWCDANSSPWYESQMSADKTAIILTAEATPAYSIPDAGTNWHYLAIVIDNPYGAVYWDGQFLGSQYLQIEGSGQTTQLGSLSPGGSDLWDGAFDDVAVYNTALSSSDITAHYDAMFGQVPATATALSISLVQGGLAITWSAASSSGLVLQQSASLSPANWSDVTNSVTTTNGINGVIVTPGGTSEFYRLVSQ